MPSNRPHRHVRFLVVLMVVLALVATACGDDDDSTSAGSSSTTAASSGGEKVAITGVPGVTDTEIRYAAFGTDSNNPLGSCVNKCFNEGVKAYFAYRNSQGGIYGRKLVLSKELDDELTKNQQRALEIVSANDTFGAFSATQFPSGWGEIVKAKIPLYVWQIHGEGAADNIFGLNAVPCFTCTRRMHAYVAEQAKATKIAALGYGISPNSKACARAIDASFKKYGSDVGGAKVVYINDSLDFGLQNGVGPEVTAMKRAGVDLVITCIDAKGDLTIAQEMARQGMADVPMYHPNLYDAEFIKTAGQAFEGDYVSSSFRPFEATKNANIDLFKTWMKKTGADPIEISFHGWVTAGEAFEGLKAAGPTFDRQKVIDATNKITRYTAGGVIPPMDFGRQHQPPVEADNATHGPDPECAPLLKIHNGAFTLTTPTDKPFVCFPGDNRDWVEPTFQSFK